MRQFSESGISVASAGASVASTVVAAAVAAWREGRAPLAATEGFVRQILGWREFIRGVYWLDMPGMSEANHFGHHRPLPRWFWSGDTRMACLAAAIRASMQQAYAHHIQRLMVIGNFALLAGVDPQALHRWYLGVYIDAFEWVELPNTAGMALYANGGRFTSKPYIASGAYINRMSNYCGSCRYDVKQRTGPDACPVNVLYWDFLASHQARFANHPRMRMMFVHVKNIAEPELVQIRAQAAAFRDALKVQVARLAPTKH